MIKPVSQRDTCRLCESGSLRLALGCAATPLGDIFVPESRLDIPQESYPLDLLLCQDCGNVQLHDIVNPEAIYPEYTYTSGVSLELPAHFRAYAEAVTTQLKLPTGALLVEMGSNEGALLRAFKERGLKVLGVDPAREIGRRANANGIPTITGYFSSPLARQIRQEHGAASVIIANNVLANIDNLDDVIAGVMDLLAPDGVFIFETSYCLDVVEKSLLDTIFHEHISYFAVGPMARFFQRHGMRMFDAVHVPTKGGSLRGLVQRAEGSRPMEAGVGNLIEQEKQANLYDVSAYQKLGAKLDSHKQELLENVRKWKSAGKRIAAYGAAVGLTTMIYHFGLGPYLDFIIDDNPAKQNLYSPGLHLSVLPSSALQDRKPDYVVVLAWRYFDAIVAKQQKFLENGGTFVLPLPKFRTVSRNAARK